MAVSECLVAITERIEAKTVANQEELWVYQEACLEKM
jgi:hypothetical protein